MPNYCECELRISGHPDAIEDFIKFIKSNDESGLMIDFNKVVPYPEAFAEADRAAQAWQDDPLNKGKNWNLRPRDGYNNGGYMWCISHWGTKWNSSDNKMTRVTDRVVLFTFTTAWSPPEPIIKKLIKDYPELYFSLEFWECGSGFHGKISNRVDWNIDYRGRRGG